MSTGSRLREFLASILAIAVLGPVLSFFLFAPKIPEPLWPLISWNPLALAIHLRNVTRAHDLIEMRTTLQRGADPNGHALTIERPLYVASSKGFDDEVIMFLNAGADPNVGFPDPKRPLAGALDGHQLATAMLLLKAGADPNIKIAIGVLGARDVTPLTLAMRHDDRTLAQLMIEKGATPDSEVLTWLANH
jgi:ankyrin repeat protein